jgi:hypothetical protein
VIDGHGNEPRRRQKTVEMVLQENKQSGRVTAAGNGGYGALAEIDPREKYSRRR